MAQGVIADLVAIGEQPLELLLGVLELVWGVRPGERGQGQNGKEPAPAKVGMLVEKLL